MIAFGACKKEKTEPADDTTGGSGASNGLVVEQVNNSLITKATATWCGPCGSWGRKARSGRRRRPPAGSCRGRSGHRHPRRISWPEEPPGQRRRNPGPGPRRGPGAASGGCDGRHPGAWTSRHAIHTAIARQRCRAIIPTADRKKIPKKDH